MNANDHVAREELARAHHLIWSTKRFRRKSGETVGRLIDRTKRLLDEQEATAVIEAAARAIPARLRPSAFAIVADLLLADGKIDARERKETHGHARCVSVMTDPDPPSSEIHRQLMEAIVVGATLALCPSYGSS